MTRTSSPGPSLRAPGPAAPPARLPSHIPALDGLRGLAIILVLAYHFFQPLRGTSPLDDVLISLTKFGWSGVDLFFVLSGFLITGILYDAREKPGYFRNFYARRFLRIFPIYYAVLAVYYVVFPIVPIDRFPEYVAESAPDQIWFWTYLTNFKIAARGEWYGAVVPSIYWSLAIEEQFYLVWPWVVLYLGRTRLMQVCAGMIAVSLVLRVVLVAVEAAPVVTYVLTPCRLDTLATGAFLALAARGGNGLHNVVPWLKRVGMVTFLFLAAVFAVRGGLWEDETIVRTVGFTAIALTYGALLASTVTAPAGTAIHRFFTSAVMQRFGKYSYALYLIHGPIYSFLQDVVPPTAAPTVLGSSLPGMLLYVSACTAASLLAGFLSWNLLEKHFLKLKRFFNA